MKRRLSTIGVLVVILALVTVGLGACARSAEEREAPEATPMGTAVVGGEETAPAPGETVVSAVTPVPVTPSAEVQPTQEAEPTSAVEAQPTSEPATAQPQPTTAPAPTTAPPPPPSGQAAAIWHTVQAGETLSSIARRYGSNWQAIARANGIVNPNQIYVGQKLKIPTSGSSGGTTGGTTGCRIRHTVRPGEWVWQIARNYGVSPYDILAANGLTIQTANTIYAGTVLCIP